MPVIVHEEVKCKVTSAGDAASQHLSLSSTARAQQYLTIPVRSQLSAVASEDVLTPKRSG